LTDFHGVRLVPDGMSHAGRVWVCELGCVRHGGWANSQLAEFEPKLPAWAGWSICEVDELRLGSMRKSQSDWLNEQALAEASWQGAREAAGMAACSAGSTGGGGSATDRSCSGAVFWAGAPFAAGTSGPRPKWRSAPWPGEPAGVWVSAQAHSTCEHLEVELGHRPAAARAVARCFWDSRRPTQHQPRATSRKDRPA